jgi:hypothetical protein
MLSFKKFYLQEGLKSKYLIPPTDVEKTTRTHVSKRDSSAFDEVYTRKSWRDKQGRLHRDDGPAMILTDNEWSLELNLNEIIQEYPNIHHIEAWYTHGKLNRENGPAKTTIKNGKIESQEWYKNGKYHRIGGPANVYISQGSGKFKDEDFYIEGKLQYKKQTSITASNRELIQYRDPQNRLHREDDKPAYILQPSSFSKTKETKWLKHGQLHRLTGPAIIINFYGMTSPSGSVLPDIMEYYIDGKQILPGEFKQLTKQYSTEDIQMYNDLTSL